MPLLSNAWKLRGIYMPSKSQGCKQDVAVRDQDFWF